MSESRQAVMVTELLLVNRLVQAVSTTPRKWRLEADPASPWLVVHFEPSWGYEATPWNGELEFGIWRRTLAIYQIRRGAADDDPIYDPADRLTLVEIRDRIAQSARADHAS